MCVSLVKGVSNCLYRTLFCCCTFCSCIVFSLFLLQLFLNNFLNIPATFHFSFGDNGFDFGGSTHKFSSFGSGSGNNYQRFHWNLNPKTDHKCYKILGLKTDATETEIKKKFRKLALKYHPDKANEQNKKKYEEKFKKIAGCYEC